MLELSRAQALAAASILLAVVLVGLALLARRNASAGVGALRLGLSQAVSAYSFWILLGVSAAAYSDGLSAAWIALGFVVGAAINGWYVGPRIRGTHAAVGAAPSVGSNAPAPVHRLPIWLSATGTIVPDLSGQSAGAGTGAGAAAWKAGGSAGAAGIVLLILVVAMVAQLRVAGRLLAAGLGIAVWLAVALIGAVVAAIVFVGGRRAAIDGASLVAILIVPLAALLLLPALLFAGSFGNLFDVLAMSGHSATSVSATGGVLSSLALVLVGLALPGLPHVLDQFEAARSDRAVTRATWISIAWFALVATLILLLGWSARVLYASVPPELVLVEAAQRLLPPYLQGLPALTVAAVVCVALCHQLRAAAEAAAPHWLAAGDPVQRPARVRRVQLVLLVLVVTVAAVVSFGSSRVLLFAVVALGAVVGPVLLARLAGTNWRPATVALTVRAGLILTLLLFLAGQGQRLSP